MLRRSIRIANSLCLESEHERVLYAGIFSSIKDWFKKKGLKNDIPSAAQDLNAFLNKNDRMSLVKIPDDYKSGKISHAKIEVLVKALSLLKEQLENMLSSEGIKTTEKSQYHTKRTLKDSGHKNRINQIQKIIVNLKELKNLVNKNEEKDIARSLGLMIFGSPKLASIKVSFEGGITEPLEGDNGDSDYAHSLDIEDAEEDE
jgi:hypothetical protein